MYNDSLVEIQGHAGLLAKLLREYMKHQETVHALPSLLYKLWNWKGLHCPSPCFTCIILCVFLYSVYTASYSHAVTKCWAKWGGTHCLTQVYNGIHGLEIGKNRHASRPPSMATTGPALWPILRPGVNGLAVTAFISASTKRLSACKYNLPYKALLLP